MDGSFIRHSGSKKELRDFMERAQGGALPESLPQWPEGGKGVVRCVSTCADAQG